MDNRTIDLVTKYCIDNLNLKGIVLGDEYYYSSLPLCVIDSVFSIGVRYEGVTYVVDRVCKHYNIENKRKDKDTLPDIKNQISTSDFLKLFGNTSIEILTSDVFKNKQRTSTRKGILKVDAAIRFLRVLKDFNIEYFQDIYKVANDKRFDECIQDIPGQRSGISLKYFFMLAGSKDLIKPDRMIKRFLQNATYNEYSDQECQEILREVTLKLANTVDDLNPRLFDYVIWNHQRKQ